MYVYSFSSRLLATSVDAHLTDHSFTPDSEIYNEKIYDLLESPIPAPAPSTSSIASGAAAASGGGMFSGFSQGAKNLFKFPTVKRSALSLKADKAAPGSSGSNSAALGGQGYKVVAGMKEIRVHSAEVRFSCFPPRVAISRSTHQHGWPLFRPE